MKFIGKILPIEGYFAVLKDNLPVDYAKSLTHLYQPLIGIEAVALYQTLLHEIELQAVGNLQTHHILMNYLNIPLDDMYKARLKLEGIGLLKTYEIVNDGEKSYTYELQCPFAPSNFFKDAMLTELLYHHLGEAKYAALKNHYQKEAVQQGKDITTSFREVFQTFEPAFEEIDRAMRETKPSIPVINPIDFSWMEMMLKQRMIPASKVLTTENKKLISEMMFLYGLATYEVEKSVLWALTEENILDTEEFKVACHDLFRTTHNEVPIELKPKKVESKPKETQTKPRTKEEEFIYQLETISPKQLLEDLSSGSNASEREMRMVREIMTNQGLPAAVMNVLIHYVLIQSNMKLSKNYLETIAASWSRANLSTAQEAMNFAKEYTEEQRKRVATQGRNQVSKEIVPDWFKERNKEQPIVEKQPEDSTSEQERKELAALLQQYAGD